MHVSVVVNPVAGGRAPTRFDPVATETLVARVATCAGASAEVRVSAGPGDIRRCVEAAVAAGADIVVAWGGDGTVNEVASVLAGTSVSLGIVPAGSGNGLARELGIPRKPAEALRLAFRRLVVPIDVGMAGGHPFVNVAGFGFDAHIARRFNESTSARGLVRYVRWTISEVFRYRPRRYHVVWEGGRFEGTALLVVFANSPQFGNGARVAPQARVDDGRLDLVAVRPTTPVRDLWRARRLFTGSIGQDGGVVAAQVAGALVEGDDLLGHVDGETIAGAGAVSLSLRARALEVCCPPRPGKG